MSQFGTLWDSHNPSKAVTGILGPVGAPTAGSESLQQSAPHGLEPHHRTMARLLWREAQASRPITALQTPTEFYRTFEAERVRTERTGSVFAVVTVHLAPEDRGDLQKCVETTQGLVRIYDTVGSLGSASVAVLLPETDPDGARSFADRLFTGLGNAGVRADLDVYSYPIDWEDEEEPPSEARPGTHAPLPRTGSHGLFALCEGHNTNGDLEPFLTQKLSLGRRAVDVVVSGTALAVGAVTILPIVSLAILIDSPKGGIFYKQPRVGIGGRPFSFWKFRSMHPGSDQAREELEAENEQTGPIFKMRRDPRITRVGRFLRKTSLDEAPQFWNVFRGDMTLVGPRPPIPAEVAEYEPWQRRRLDVVPGLTCLWQVGGRSDIGFVDWMRMDLRYIRRRTLKLDLWILWRTPLAILLGRGAY